MGVGDRGLRNHPEADQAIWIDRAVILGQENRCRRAIPNDRRRCCRCLATDLGPADTGKQHLGVDPVTILLGDALLGGARAPRRLPS